MLINQIFNFFLILSLTIPIAASIKLEGENGSENTFKVPIGPISYFKGDTQLNFRVMIGASQELENNLYSVCYAQSDSKKFIPFFMEEVFYMGSKQLVSQGNGFSQRNLNLNKISNPIIGKAISSLDSIGFNPVIVVKNNGVPENFFYIYYYDANNPRLQSSGPLNDANGNESGQIKNILAQEGYIISAVTPNGSSEFGNLGSGFNLAKSNVETVRNQKNSCKKDDCKNSCNFCKSNCEVSNYESIINSSNAFPVDTSSSFLKINNNLSYLTPTSSVFFQKLGISYLAFNLETNGMASSGGIGLAKASISNNTLTINAVAPSDIISTANDIIGALGSNTNINLKYLDTLYTSTYLTYLVIGSEVDGDVNFYSLPVVGTEANKGMIADLNSVPKEVYVDNKLTERVFYVPALTSSDFDIAAHPELKIGGSKVLPGDFAQISSMSSSGDAVFISVKSGDNTGIFYSRAIFDENGVIAGWTDWQRSAGGDMPAEAVLLNKRNADIWTVTNNAYDVRRTVWGVDYNDQILGGTIDSNGYAQLNNLFFEDGGIQSLNEITNQGGISTFALTITTGYKKVALANTGICNGSYYTPNVGDYKTNSVYSEDGSWINADNSSRFIAISGGELDNIGPVVTSTIYTNLNENWLIVAGYGGLAVMQNNGNGWQNLSGLVFNGGFKLIDGPDRIIKILSDNNYLYILTQNNLYKAKLDAASINQGEYLEINSIAQTDEDNKVFYDFVINKGNIYLATTLGLYYLDGTWQKVAIPGVNLPVNLINIIKTDFADQLYTLSGYRGFNESFENRFYIPNNQLMPVPLPDKIFKDSGIPFLNFGSFIDYFYTDGFRWLRMQAKNGKTNALLAQIVNTKTLFAGINGLTLPFTNSSYVGKILQLKSVGSLLINGSFGLWINE